MPLPGFAAAVLAVAVVAALGEEDQPVFVESRRLDLTPC
jgi:hypothetical protein